MNNNAQYIKKNLINWYDINRRDLPWRNKFPAKQPDSYGILVSEIMLQQTTVASVKKKYIEFIKKWPSINKLSKATESQILKFWAGMGYYNRALNLLKCAKIIRKKYNSKVPNSEKELLLLPGIGKYTSSALLGIAFNKPVMAVDANVERLISRVLGLQKPKSKIKLEIENYSKLLINKKRPGDMIQSLMDYGSLICKPRNPLCRKCCIKKKCKAYKVNLTEQIPLKNTIRKRNKPIKYAYAYLVTNNEKKILLRKRTVNGIFPLMLEIPTSDWLKKPLLEKQILKFSPIKINYTKKRKLISYSFSHFELKIRILFAKTKIKFVKNCKWYSLKDIPFLELPTLMRVILKTHL